MSILPLHQTEKPIFMYKMEIWLLKQDCNSPIVIKKIAITIQDNPSGNQKLDQQQVLVLSRALAGRSPTQAVTKL